MQNDAYVNHEGVWGEWLQYSSAYA